MKPPAPLIDVLSPESFAAERLPGAVNICGYEMAFVDHVRAAFPDPASPVTLYGESDATREAETAADRLRAAGYANVQVLPGGLAGWKANGGAVEGGTGSAPPADGRLAIDVEASALRWTGRNLFNFHAGTAALAEGWVEFRDGALVAARIAVDMESLRCTDIADTAMNALLIAHLRSEDFFAVSDYPRATFELTAATAIPAAPAGSPTHHVRGAFTLRGHTEPLGFDALLAQKGDGTWVAQATLDLDRTLWGSIYGSGRFFARLGQHVVNDLVHLHLKVVTRPPAAEPSPAAGAASA